MPDGPNAIEPWQIFAHHGGLHADQSLQIMESYLRECTIPVEIYTYDRHAPDELYKRFRTRFLGMSTEDIGSATKVALQLHR